MTDAQLMRLLEARLERAGTVKNLAADLGISATYLADILSRRSEPGPKVLAALGLKRESRYSVVAK